MNLAREKRPIEGEALSFRAIYVRWLKPGMPLRAEAPADATVSYDGREVSLSAR